MPRSLTTQEIGPLVAQLLSHIPDPVQGLPEEVFHLVSRITPMVNVDLLIQDGNGRTLLTWRDDGFFPAGWHVPGGIIRFSETLASRIHTVAKRELGVEVEFGKEPVAMHEIFHPSRNERGHFISFLFRCKILNSPDESLRFKRGNPKSGEWSWHNGCPDGLIPVHQIYREFM